MMPSVVPPVPVMPAPAPVKPAPAASVPALPNPARSEADRFERVCLEFEQDAEFHAHPPTRDQIARALVLAKFNKSNPSEWPTRIELVAALKKLFPEFRKR
jgi:hypothetical protein